MYKCQNCRAVFEEPEEFNEEATSVPSPFGSGSCSYGGGSWEGCPECQSPEFDEVEFDGSCDCGQKVLDDEDWDFYDDLECECPRCKLRFDVSMGKIIYR